MLKISVIRLTNNTLVSVALKDSEAEIQLLLSGFKNPSSIAIRKKQDLKAKNFLEPLFTL